jgi:hypothetical protein
VVIVRVKDIGALLFQNELFTHDFDNEDPIVLLHDRVRLELQNANDAQKVEVVAPGKLSFVIVVVAR